MREVGRSGSSDSSRGRWSSCELAPCGFHVGADGSGGRVSQSILQVPAVVAADQMPSGVAAEIEVDERANLDLRLVLVGEAHTKIDRTTGRNW
jgi:hypothetical protein